MSAGAERGRAVGWAETPVWDLDADVARLDPGVPERLDRTPDVLVVGGGVVGLAAAALCRRAGIGRVLVVERGRLASGPSGRGEGILRPEPRSWEAEPPEGFTAFAWRALGLWRALDQEWGGELGVLPYDWFMPDAGAGTMAGAGGLPPGAVRVGPGEVGEVDPHLPAGTGGLLVRGQARVHPLRLAAALARRAGSVATGVEVTGIDAAAAAGGALTVRTSHGDLHPGAVVLATGPVPRLAGIPPGRVRRLVKGCMVATVPAPFRLRVGLAAEGGMLLQTPDGRLVFGASPDPDDPSPRAHAAAVAATADRLRAALPAAAGLPVSHAWACHRAAAAGEVPVIDRVDGLPGVWATYGHYRTGFLLAAATGEALASWIAGGRRPAGVEPFAAPHPAVPVRPAAAP